MYRGLRIRRGAALIDSTAPSMSGSRWPKETAMPRSDRQPDVAVVAIGRNEGERLQRCLESVRPQCETIVYVDSGSDDGSVDLARGLGVEVVELDMSIPFTAARARNEGLRRLRELRPSLEYVQ